MILLLCVFHENVLQIIFYDCIGIQENAVFDLKASFFFSDFKGNENIFVGLKTQEILSILTIPKNKNNNNNKKKHKSKKQQQKRDKR